MRIAVASTRDGDVYPGHFAHAELYLIYEWDGSSLRLVEVRENPLGMAPDEDAPMHHGHHHHHHVPEELVELGVPLHGPPKYLWLREALLGDVGAVIAAAACQTSHTVFTSEGVRMLYVDPVSVEELERFINENPEELKRALGEP